VALKSCKQFTSISKVTYFPARYSNGVSHLMVNDELEGVQSIVNWLSYIPHKKGAMVPIIDPVDPVDRLIDFVPPSSSGNQ
jgi:acetyl-CoA carboxylase carboxyltransferase component